MSEVNGVACCESLFLLAARTEEPFSAVSAALTEKCQALAMTVLLPNKQLIGKMATTVNQVITCSLTGL